MLSGDEIATNGLSKMAAGQSALLVRARPRNAMAQICF
jgi:hypothetical protein